MKNVGSGRETVDQLPSGNDGVANPHPYIPHCRI